MDFSFKKVFLLLSGLLMAAICSFLALILILIMPSPVPGNKAKLAETNLKQTPNPTPTPQTINKDIPRSAEGELSIQTIKGSVSKIGKSIAFECYTRESDVMSRNAVGIKSGSVTYYTGYKTSLFSKKDPVIIAFEKGVFKWCKDDYEFSADETQGYGMLIDEEGELFVLLSTKTENDTNEFDQYTSNGWLSTHRLNHTIRSTVLAKIDTESGRIDGATYISAEPTKGLTGELDIKTIKSSGENITLTGVAYGLPRGVDTYSLSCKKANSYTFSLALDKTLTYATTATAQNCN